VIRGSDNRDSRPSDGGFLISSCFTRAGASTSHAPIPMLGQHHLSGVNGRTEVHRPCAFAGLGNQQRTRRALLVAGGIRNSTLSALTSVRRAERPSSQRVCSSRFFARERESDFLSVCSSDTARMLVYEHGAPANESEPAGFAAGASPQTQGRYFWYGIHAAEMVLASMGN